jgi:hypothetical protein
MFKQMGFDRRNGFCDPVMQVLKISKWVGVHSVFHTATEEQHPEGRNWGTQVVKRLAYLDQSNAT